MSSSLAMRERRWRHASPPRCSSAPRGPSQRRSPPRKACCRSAPSSTKNCSISRTSCSTSELAGGKRSYLLNLGDLLFSSSAIFGGVARQAGISCETCHQQGHNNPRLFVPGLSSRPGTFDTTGALFNAKADNGVFDPVTPPSLRGAKYLAPYGHDGRFASLRDFMRNVIVNEFAGSEPSAQILDALDHLYPGNLFPAQSEAGRRRPPEQRGLRRGAPRRDAVQQAVPARCGDELRQLPSDRRRLRRPPGARRRHRRLVQDPDADQRQLQRALFPRRPLRQLRPRWSTISTAISISA